MKKSREPFSDYGQVMEKRDPNLIVKFIEDVLLPKIKENTRHVITAKGVKKSIDKGKMTRETLLSVDPNCDVDGAEGEAERLGISMSQFYEIKKRFSAENVRPGEMALAIDHIAKGGRDYNCQNSLDAFKGWYQQRVKRIKQIHKKNLKQYTDPTGGP